MFKYIWFITIGGTLWCKTINIRGIILVGFSLHGEHGKENPNKWWSLSCKASDYRGLGDGTLVFFLASNFLDHGCENIKPVFDFLKSGTDTVCKRHVLQTKSKDWCCYSIYKPGLSELQQSGPCPPCCSEPRQWHARAFCPPWGEREQDEWSENPSWWWRLANGELVHSLINLTLHITTCKSISHVP